MYATFCVWLICEYAFRIIINYKFASVYFTRGLDGRTTVSKIPKNVMKKFKDKVESLKYLTMTFYTDWLKRLLDFLF